MSALNSRALAIAASLLLAVTTVVGVAGAFTGGHPVLGVILGVGFLGAYAAGMMLGHRAHASSEDLGQGVSHGRYTIVWMLVLTLIWVGLLAVSDTAIWLAFALVIIQVGVLGPLWGSVAAGITGLIAVGISVARLPADHPVGAAILGPLLGVGIALVITWAGVTVITEAASLRKALRELSQARTLLDRAEEERILQRERARMAGEIHDTVSQDLSGVAMLLQVAQTSRDPHEVARLIDQSLQATQGALADARRVTKALAPRELSAGRLEVALRGLANEPVLRGLNITFDIDEGVATLNLGQEAALLRVAKSALVNVKEHSGTAAATVRLQTDEGAVRLEVEDRGQGFDTSMPEDGRGFGIPAMRERMSEVGGALEIFSEDGVLVRASVPIGSVGAE
ncbi:sensor histidine kinase [Actinomyces sp. S4-C9]|uniref:sensor histidine kinase n=1 Tax=Actinomyces sp. S4-C9 TaxID=1219581 RepID=UPI00050FBED7|nr:sensor histidine kinase [Actinomyces sp. S4-C9]KGF01758.1 hypothetical protein HMPREF1628_05510 [Actinomyces sp. S4-C9]